MNPGLLHCRQILTIWATWKLYLIHISPIFDYSTSDSPVWFNFGSSSSSLVLYSQFLGGFPPTVNILNTIISQGYITFRQSFLLFRLQHFLKTHFSFHIFYELQIRICHHLKAIIYVLRQLTFIISTLSLDYSYSSMPKTLDIILYFISNSLSPRCCLFPPIPQFTK